MQPDRAAWPAPAAAARPRQTRQSLHRQLARRRAADTAPSCLHPTCMQPSLPAPTPPTTWGASGRGMRCQPAWRRRCRRACRHSQWAAFPTATAACWTCCPFLKWCNCELAGVTLGASQRPRCEVHAANCRFPRQRRKLSGEPLSPPPPLQAAHPPALCRLPVHAARAARCHGAVARGQPRLSAPRQLRCLPACTDAGGPQLRLWNHNVSVLVGCKEVQGHRALQPGWILAILLYGSQPSSC